MQEYKNGIRFLIVDDESKTRNGLKKYVHWNNLGINELRYAANGIEALSICREFKPDIILADVRMPGMDGVTLCRHLREFLPYCQIIFLSGYSDKEYLKAAIDLGAVSYVEKPTVIRDVEDAVTKAVSHFTEDKTLRLNGSMFVENSTLLQRSLVEYLITGTRQGEIDEEKLEKSFHSLHCFEKDGLSFRAAVIQTEGKIDSHKTVLLELSTLLHEKDVEHLEMVKDEEHIVIIFGTAFPGLLEPRSRLFHALEYAACRSGLGGNAFFCSVGTEVPCIEKTLQSYQTAVIALQQLFFTGYGRVVFYQKKEFVNLHFDEELFTQKFSKALLCNKTDEIKELLQAIYQSLSKQDTVLAAQIKNLYLRLFYQVMRISRSYFDKQNMWEQFLQADTLKDIHRFLCHAVEDALTHPTEEENLSLSVKCVMKHIRVDFSTEDLSVQQLADKVHLTAAYLSNLFKKETGVTVGQYIVKVRIEHAMILLQSESHHLNEIASLVGYSDAGYFTKIFKKNMNMTPSQYRRQLGKNLMTE